MRGKIPLRRFVSTLLTVLEIVWARRLVAGKRLEATAAVKIPISKNDFNGLRDVRSLVSGEFHKLLPLRLVGSNPTPATNFDSESGGK